MSARKDNWQGMNWIRQDKRMAIYHRDGFACTYCRAGSEDGSGLALDHVLAHELGGSNHETNLVTACVPCNSAKAHRTLRAWLQYLRDRGVATEGMAKRIRKQTARKLDRAEGKRLLALRRAA
jgi:5-methylcytosine-specific restriction endonuclease McrA